MVLVTSAALILNSLLVFLVFRRNSGAILSIQLWWLIWLLFAHGSFTGLFAPSQFTTLLVIGSVFAVSLGGIAHEFFAKRFQRIPDYLLKKENISHSIEKKMLLLTWYISLPFTVFFFTRFLWLVRLEPSLAVYRSKVFGDGSPYPLLYRFNAVMSFDWFVIEPLILAALFIGIAIALASGRRRLFLWASAIVIAHNVMMGGRFGIHYVMTMSGFLFVVAINTNRYAVKKLFAYLVLALVLMTGALALITSLRVSDSNKAVTHDWSRSIHQFIDYHTIGFSIFDHDIMRPDSLLHRPSYGRSSLGAIDRLAVRFLRLFGSEKVAQSEWNGATLQTHRIIGRNADGAPMHYNAFGTVFYSLYRDGGILMCIFGATIFGFYLARFSAAISSRNFYGLAMVSALFFIGIYGIFQPILESPIYLTLLLMRFVIPKYSHES
jgi:oligosaccharide repeat unit polymerase